ncbi:uncharacterized protein TRIVIDRAFT_221583 [Trichoderma virens Gv29-8]|uniref:Uncharacterized protein n=1 Tax=Hypocrea virens (strain Gv29-8 / FGSC 10586) TaxID=413071 RepID=G9MT99_HYPVG|nr:uncharacterized protein TRIVIDRAFT_221583 [Trichoderma virens Gv29-8]EHK22299.1 hypothetical protein TRIVIDRAFT_221583 [Trichoderma virens Gv29-8]UKZ47337.1 hypothetical protein TrVGV298_001555 [Trichoderma virens]
MVRRYPGPTFKVLFAPLVLSFAQSEAQTRDVITSSVATIRSHPDWSRARAIGSTTAVPRIVNGGIKAGRLSAGKLQQRNLANSETAFRPPLSPQPSTSPFRR